MGDSAVVLEMRGDLGLLWLDSPPRNEMGVAFFDDLARCIDHDLAGRALQGLVVLGRGRHFSSGAAVDEVTNLARQEGAGPFFAQNTATLEAIASLPFPVVAAIAGCCLGSGLELALACDYRIAAPNAVLGLVEAEHGLVPGCGGMVRLTSLLGRSRAIELVLSARSLLAGEALEAGLVDAVAERREILAVAQRLIVAHALGAA